MECEREMEGNGKYLVFGSNMMLLYFEYLFNVFKFFLFKYIIIYLKIFFSLYLLKKINHIYTHNTQIKIKNQLKNLFSPSTQ